jgi:hypothetical protein
MGQTQGVTSWFVAHGYSPPTAQWASARLVDLSVQAQSYTMAVDDTFLLVLVVFTVSLPLVLLLRKTDPGSVAVAGH